LGLQWEIFKSGLGLHFKQGLKLQSGRGIRTAGVWVALQTRVAVAERQRDSNGRHENVWI
jgi:hypothetical protein